MKIQKVTDKNRWDQFLIEREKLFPQSIDWGDLKAQTQRVERLEAVESGKLVGVCQFLEEKNPVGEYFYIPYGPIADKQKIREKLIEEVSKIGRKEGKVFVKVEPLQEINSGQSTPHRMQPQRVLIRDISDDPEEILQSFKEGTRYDVRYSRRQDVEVETSENLDPFFDLMRETMNRKSFESFSKDYFKNLLDMTDSDLLLAIHEGDVVAATIFGYFGKVTTSLHSAFDYDKRKLRATALIRFEAIKEAKKNGCTIFNAWGIDEDKIPGVTKFKKGFGGEPVDYPEVRDVPLKKMRHSGYKLAYKLFKQ